MDSAISVATNEHHRPLRVSRMLFTHKYHFIALLLPQIAIAANVSPSLDLAIKGDLLLVSADTQHPPWWDKGSGQLAYEGNQLLIGNQVASLLWTGEGAFTARVNAEASSQAEYPLGIIEAWLNWSPLPINRYRLRARFGAFYPAFSLENTDTAWTSPYSHNFSAINSWFAEELKTYGAEVSLTRPGRFFQLPYSVTGVAGSFIGNDAIGTILSWRGFAIHNNQTHIGEQVNFADYPSLKTGPLAAQPNWVNPTPELDNRVGYYVGGHWRHRNGTEARLYYYDNNGDPLVLKHGQYAWDTRFTSLALRYPISNDLHLVAQWLNGSTEMGDNAVIVDFNAWFALLNWQRAENQFSLRYEVFATKDKDNLPNDDNNGQGDAFTLAWQRHLSPALSWGLEGTYLDSTQASRKQLSQAEQQTATSLLARLTYRW